MRDLKINGINIEKRHKLHLINSLHKLTNKQY